LTFLKNYSWVYLDPSSCPTANGSHVTVKLLLCGDHLVLTLSPSGHPGNIHYVLIRLSSRVDGIKLMHAWVLPFQEGRFLCFFKSRYIASNWSHDLVLDFLKPSNDVIHTSRTLTKIEGCYIFLILLLQNMIYFYIFSRIFSKIFASIHKDVVSLIFHSQLLLCIFVYNSINAQWNFLNV
jgi:hypothetical protein